MNFKIRNWLGNAKASLMGIAGMIPTFVVGLTAMVANIFVPNNPLMRFYTKFTNTEVDFYNEERD